MSYCIRFSVLPHIHALAFINYRPSMDSCSSIKCLKIMIKFTQWIVSNTRSCNLNVETE